MKFEKKMAKCIGGEVVQICERSDGRTDDRRGLIAIAHPEPSAQDELKMFTPVNLSFTI